MVGIVSVPSLQPNRDKIRAVPLVIVRWEGDKSEDRVSSEEDVSAWADNGETLGLIGLSSFFL